MDYELDQLKREFLAEAFEKAREIESKIKADLGPESLDRLTYLAHQLKGSGGSYGFQAISDDAAELEKGVEKLSHNGSGHGLVEKIQKRAASLRAEIVKQSDELGGAR